MALNGLYGKMKLSPNFPKHINNPIIVLASELSNITLQLRQRLIIAKQHNKVITKL